MKGFSMLLEGKNARMEQKVEDTTRLSMALSKTMSEKGFDSLTPAKIEFIICTSALPAFA